MLARPRQRVTFPSPRQRIGHIVVCTAICEARTRYFFQALQKCSAGILLSGRDSARAKKIKNIFVQASGLFFLPPPWKHGWVRVWRARADTISGTEAAAGQPQRSNGVAGILACQVSPHYQLITSWLQKAPARYTWYSVPREPNPTGTAEFFGKGFARLADRPQISGGAGTGAGATRAGRVGT